MSKRLFFILTIILLIVTFSIRGFGLLSSPPSLYWEEVAIGYDAYAIIKTGHDHHGQPWPILAFESFGDWKPALYFYLVAGAELILGLTPLAVRLPALLSGVAMVIAVAWLIKYLLEDHLSSENIRLLMVITLLVGGLSPWGVMFSRAGWESMVAASLLAWGGLGWVYAGKAKHKMLVLILSTLLLALSAYTYHAARLIAPLLFVWLLINFVLPKKITYAHMVARVKSNIWSLAVSTLLIGLLLSPFMISLKSNQISDRFNTTSIFADGAIVRESNQLRQTANFSLPSRLIYHRYVLSMYQIAENLVSHFNLNYLFVRGDQNWRHSTQFFGQLYWGDAILLPLGIIWWWRKNQRGLWLLGGYLLICLLPSSISTGAPHAVRTLASLPVWWILTATGFYAVLTASTRHLSQYGSLVKSFVVGALILLYVGQFGWFYYHYRTVYPRLSASAWQYGYYQLFTALAKLEDSHSDGQIYVTREQGRPAMYYFFFNRIDPVSVQQFDQVADQDQGEFLNFGRYHFVDDLAQVPVGSIVAGSPDKLKTQLPDARVIQNITSLDGSTIWQIAQL